MEDRSIGTVMGTVTARFPKGPNAPYLFAGGGVQFGGLKRPWGRSAASSTASPRTKACLRMLVWMFSEHENAAVFRTGMSFAFGPGEPPPSYKTRSDARPFQAADFPRAVAKAMFSTS